ncbi:hypothetical protein H4582DRAFT_2051287 [Lactarius indigo]|nr:hypothetical protein H4582DRAFT_2051287 [Lactarius indigo]
MVTQINVEAPRHTPPAPRIVFTGSSAPLRNRLSPSTQQPTFAQWRMDRMILVRGPDRPRAHYCLPPCGTFNEIRNINPAEGTSREVIRPFISPRIKPTAYLFSVICIVTSATTDFAIKYSIQCRYRRRAARAAGKAAGLPRRRRELVEGEGDHTVRNVRFSGEPCCRKGSSLPPQPRALAIHPLDPTSRSPWPSVFATQAHQLFILPLWTFLSGVPDDPHTWQQRMQADPQEIWRVTATQVECWLVDAAQTLCAYPGRRSEPRWSGALRVPREVMRLDLDIVAFARRSGCNEAVMMLVAPGLKQSEAPVVGWCAPVGFKRA